MKITSFKKIKYSPEYLGATNWTKFRDAITKPFRPAPPKWLEEKIIAANPTYGIGPMGKTERERLAYEAEKTAIENAIKARVTADLASKKMVLPETSPEFTPEGALSIKTGSMIPGIDNKMIIAAIVAGGLFLILKPENRGRSRAR